MKQLSTTIFTTMSALAQQHQAINLGQGFPDFAADSALLDAAYAAMQAGHNQYAPMIGTLPLRQTISALVNRHYGFVADVDKHITITAGASEALFCAILAITEPQDELIILEPAYDLYRPAIINAGGRPVAVNLHLNDKQEFVVDWAAVEAAVTSKTRAIIVNTPNNPTGNTFTADDLVELERIAEHYDVWVISDEVYEHMVFDGALHQSALRRPALAARTIHVASFGKTLHVTGWKIGYTIAPERLTQAIRAVHQFNTFTVATPLQLGIAQYLNAHPNITDELPAFYQTKRDAFRQGLAMTGLRLLPCQGTYFQLVDYGDLSSFSKMSDVEFAVHLTREVGVAAIPLSPFYGVPLPQQTLVRFCFAKEEQTLVAALDKLCSGLKP
ncbi:methionine aminotransferase [Hydromonas duriensis]|uniref:2-keto-4-methylthiobutyrate aminotransferase n=1 Tax=Hydromonas duriensis TaxID=1527608 RepID=A0A4R6YBN2_9BURK|nr:methionine aminotransferase [Hydromonas duriensis]TDR32968.1 2-keto-4-methylthiobutyrate aminotransferase [Hydromonas duriensis]